MSTSDNYWMQKHNSDKSHVVGQNDLDKHTNQKNVTPGKCWSKKHRLNKCHIRQTLARQKFVGQMLSSITSQFSKTFKFNKPLLKNISLRRQLLLNRHFIKGTDDFKWPGRGETPKC